MGQRKYDASFKRESIQMMESSVSAAAVSEKLGVHIKTLYRWRDEQRRDGEHAFPGIGNLTPADAELREMRCLSKHLRAQGHNIGRTQVERLMRKNSIIPKR